MVFLNPLFLWTLLGLSIPIAIHFWNKKKVKTIKIGSTQLLKEQNPKQTSSIRLNQWVLLILRMILLALIALIISGPSIEYIRKEKSLTYLVEPSLLKFDKIIGIIDSIDEGEIRLLYTGFPKIEESDKAVEFTITPNYWQLAQEMEQLDTDSIIVFTKALIKGVRGMRPETKIPINWVLIDEEEKTSVPVELRRKDQQIDLITLQSDHSKLSYLKENYTLGEDLFYTDNKDSKVFTKLNTDTIALPIVESDKKEVLLVYDDDFAAEKWYINSAFQALSKYLDLNIDVTYKQDIQGLDLTAYEILVWLKNEPLVPFNGSILFFQFDEYASNLIVPSDSMDQYMLNNHLNAENSVSQNLPAQLLVLLKSHDTMKDKILEFDQRIIAVDELRTNENFTNNTKSSKSQKDISSWLWAFLLCILPIERVLSKIRKQ